MSFDLECKVRNMADIANLNLYFSIPYYQRPYAWREGEIIQLLNDVNNAQGDYYIGNIFCHMRNGSLAVVDGQQRLTTLMLLMAYAKRRFNFCNGDVKCLSGGKGLRLSFMSRDEHQRVLDDYIDGRTDDLSRVLGFENARLAFEKFFSLLDDTGIQGFFEKICTRVKFALVKLPEQFDCAEYFEVMNSRSKQLEKHQILKARLLKVKNEDERKMFSKIWDACSQMDRFCDYGLSPDVKFVMLKWATGTEAQLPDEIKKSFVGDGWQKRKLNDILISKEDSQSSGHSSADEICEEDCVQGEAILNFAEFLLLARNILRLCALENKSQADKIELDALDDAKLLDIFEKDLHKKVWTTGTVEEFITQLFRIRILFDQYIIRGFKDEPKNSKWWIRPLREMESECDNERNATRVDLKQEEMPKIMIQAMLHVSGANKNRWLAPFIARLMTNSNSESSNPEDKAYNELLENEQKIFKDRIGWKEGCFEIKDRFDKGVYVGHYVFYRLEYILWYKLFKGREKFSVVVDRKYSASDYVFRTRNTVEHIFPQNPDKADSDWAGSDVDNPIRKVDYFGNLCLLSRSANSSYNDQLPVDKRLDFSKKSEIESMKLLEVYKNPDSGDWSWTYDQAKKMREAHLEMLFGESEIAKLYIRD